MDGTSKETMSDAACGAVDSSSCLELLFLPPSRLNALPLLPGAFVAYSTEGARAVGDAKEGGDREGEGGTEGEEMPATEEGGTTGNATEMKQKEDDDHGDHQDEVEVRVKGPIESSLDENHTDDREGKNAACGGDRKAGEGMEEEDEDEEEDEEEDEDGEDGDGDSLEEEEEEEEEEPRLKYQRLGNSASDILKRESASAVRLHEKFLALGTVEGWIYILDFDGNEVRRFGAHTAIVNDLSIDRAGEFIASCSDDGTVVINGLFSAECESFTYQRPVKSLALDAKFSRKANRHFASGGLAGQVQGGGERGAGVEVSPCQLLLNEKGWFTSKDKVIHAGEGPGALRSSQATS
eukprot:768466-Hanusia_phi.AAC.5